jgi:uncharacterized protein (DUF427 family)
VLILRETRHAPVYYFLKSDINMEFLENPIHRTKCLKKGDASYWDITSNDKVIENSAWSYENPISGAEKLAGYIAFYFKMMDHWYEDEDEIFVHPKDPFVRIDVRRSKQSVRVVIGGETISQTRRARLLYETGAVTRYYIPKKVIHMELLQSSNLITSCPYKGTCNYWSLKINNLEFENVVWSYMAPNSEALGIKNLLCFYNEKVDEIFIDDKPASTLNFFVV